MRLDDIFYQTDKFLHLDTYYTFVFAYPRFCGVGPCGAVGPRRSLWLFLCELLASPHLADLVGLVVPAGGALAAVVLALTPVALTAPLPFLLLVTPLRTPNGGPVGTTVVGSAVVLRPQAVRPAHVGGAGGCGRP